MAQSSAQVSVDDFALALHRLQIRYTTEENGTLTAALRNGDWYVEHIGLTVDINGAEIILKSGADFLGEKDDGFVPDLAFDDLYVVIKKALELSHA